jgi:hypothetical protein
MAADKFKLPGHRLHINAGITNSVQLSRRASEKTAPPAYPANSTLL